MRLGHHQLCELGGGGVGWVGSVSPERVTGITDECVPRARDDPETGHSDADTSKPRTASVRRADGKDELDVRCLKRQGTRGRRLQ